MMTLLGFLIFSGALTAALYAIVATIAPSFDRIADALAGRPIPAFQPLDALVQAERRIAIRRWATDRPRSPARARAAA